MNWHVFHFKFLFIFKKSLAQDSKLVIFTSNGLYELIGEEKGFGVVGQNGIIG